MPYIASKWQGGCSILGEIVEKSHLKHIKPIGESMGGRLL